MQHIRGLTQWFFQKHTIHISCHHCSFSFRIGFPLIHHGHGPMEVSWLSEGTSDHIGVFQCFPHFSNPTINTINLASTGWSWAAIRPIKGATPFVELLLRSRALASVSQGNDDLGKLFLTLAILKRKFWNTSLGKLLVKEWPRAECRHLKYRLFVLTWSNKIKCPKMLLQLPVGVQWVLKWLWTIRATHHSVHNSPSCGRILMWFPCPLAQSVQRRRSNSDDAKQSFSSGFGKAKGWPGQSRWIQCAPWSTISMAPAITSLFLSSLQAKRIRCPCKTLAAVRVEAGWEDGQKMP